MGNNYASVQFCDEIKTEDNGKKMFLGVYSTEMVVPSLPYKQQRLFLLVTYSTPLKKPVGLKNIKIISPDREPTFIEFPFQGLPPKNPDKGTKILQFKGVAKIEPFLITKEGRIFVFLECLDGKEIYAGSLKVVLDKGLIKGSPIQKTGEIFQLLQLFRENSEKVGRRKGAYALKILKTMNRIFGNPSVIPKEVPLAYFPRDENSLELYFRKPFSKAPKINVEIKDSESKVFVKNVDEFGFILRPQKGKEIPSEITIQVNEEGGGNKKK